MLSKLKEHWAIILIVFVSLLTIVLLVLLIVFHVTHTCVAYEQGDPTGSKCISWSTHTQTIGKVTTFHRQCIQRGPCRKCLEYLPDEEVKIKINKPADACD